MLSPDFVRHAARVAHEANRAYCLTLGDNSQPSWDDAPAWQKESAIKGVLAIISAVANGREYLPFDSHESWLKEKQAAGWTYGQVKDVVKKEHPCMMRYYDLPAEQQKKDALFVAVVKEMIRG